MTGSWDNWVALLILILWGGAPLTNAQGNAPHTCDEACEHPSKGILATHTLADPATITALFDAEEGANFDLAVFADALLVPPPAGSPPGKGASQRWKSRWEDGRWKGRVRKKATRATRSQRRDEDGGGILEGNLTTLDAKLEGGGELFLVCDGTSWTGRVAFRGSTDAWTFQGNGAEGHIDTRLLTSMLCSFDDQGQAAAGLPPIATTNPNAEPKPPVNPFLREGRAAPILNSYPDATGVIYLDFDGETVSGSSWNSFYTGGNDIVAEPSGFSIAQIQLIWESVSEDYRPFNLNVTTDRAVFEAAPVNRRTMMIFTPTNEWYGAAGGVAFTGTFGSSSYDEPAWVFTDQVLYNDAPHAPYAAEAASHEAGHTLGLSHHGTSSDGYYAGHGSGDSFWAPIMGDPYLASITHWSKGEYPDANNPQDDLAIIAGFSNGLGYRPEDVSLFGDLNGDGTPFSGVIGHFGDVDLFMLRAEGGFLTLSAENAATDPNLDIELRLLDSDGNLMAQASPEGDLDASLELLVPEGSYQVEITGGGNGDLVTGYSDYGSLGAYTLVAHSGQGTAPVAVEILSPAASGVSLPAGTGLVLEGSVARGTPEWAVIAAPDGGSALLSAPHAASPRCEFSGAGVYEIRLQAVNVSASETAILTVTVEDGELAEPPEQTLLEQTLISHDYHTMSPSDSRSQTFSFSSGTGTYSLGRVEVYLRSTDNTPEQNISVSIRTAWDGGVLWAGTLQRGDLSDLGEWEQLDITPSLQLDDGVTYFLHVTTDNSDGDFYWHLSDLDPYPNGSQIKENGDPDLKNDQAFRLHGWDALPLTGTGVDLGPDSDVYGDQLALNPGIIESAPFAPLDYHWTVLSGGAVFSDPHATNPELTFLAPGPVHLRLVVDTGSIATYGEVMLNGKFLTTGLPGGSGVRAFVPTDGALDGLWQQNDFDDSAWQSAEGGAVGYDTAGVSGPFGAHIAEGTDLTARMYGVSSSCYLRVPFTVDAPDAVVALDLDLHYDDGFVAYINGTEVARANVGSAPVGESSGLAVWSSGTTPNFNAWNGTDFGSTENADGNGRWRIMQGATCPIWDEAIVIGVEEDGEISATLWNGSWWSDDGLTALASVTENTWWSCAVAYEHQSGDAMIVYADDDSAPHLSYKIWDGFSWSDPQAIPTWVAGPARHLRLAADPNSDGMVLVVSATNERDYVLVWNGSSWSATGQMDASTAQNHTDINVAYESLSGRAVIVYETNTDSNLNYRVWNGSSWSGQGTINAPAGVSGFSRWSVVATDPSSNRIVLGVQSDDGPDGWVTIWNGSSWETASLLTPDSLNLDSADAPNLAVAFEGLSGQALAVWGQTNAQDVLFSTWNESTWSTPQLSGRIDKHTRSLILSADTRSDRIMLSVQDDSKDLNFVQWNGDEWGTPHELETDTKESNNQPFVFLWDQVQPDSGSGPSSGPAGWNTRAAFDRPDNAALSPVRYRLAVPAGLLVAGQNVLAIHGLNSSGTAADERFLLAPELSATLAEWPVFTFISQFNGSPGSGSGFAFAGDPDGDRMSNLMEYATGNDPESDEVGLLEVQPGAQDGTVDVRLRLPVSPPPDVRYEILCRTALLDPWTVIATRDAGGPWAGVQPFPPAEVGTSHEIHAFPQTELEAGFYKFKVSLIEPF